MRDHNRVSSQQLYPSIANRQSQSFGHNSLVYGIYVVSTLEKIFCSVVVVSLCYTCSLVGNNMHNQIKLLMQQFAPDLFIFGF